MFVRWKKYKLKLSSIRSSSDFSFTAQLVESYRVDGKPRQRVIRSLATFNERRFDEYNEITRANTKAMFWKRVGWKLDEVGECLTLENREKIERVLAERVPKPTEVELAMIEEDDRKIAAMMRAFRVEL